MRNSQDKGIALITTLLVLMLMSTMMVGLAWLVMGDQKLGGNNRDRQVLVLYRKRVSKKNEDAATRSARFRYSDLKEAARGCGRCGRYAI